MKSGWEYKIVNLEGILNPEQLLNELGREAWELVSVEARLAPRFSYTTGRIEMTPADPNLFFKRPIVVIDNYPIDSLSEDNHVP